ncbi:MAG: hypothetical protein ACE5LU_01975 [Anaerolineae bacterium]
MKIWIDRDECTATLSTCESCFGQLVRTGVPDRGCILAYKDDGSEDLTIFMHSDNHQEMIIIPKEMRELVAYDGWSKFVDWEPRFRKNEGTERLAEEKAAAR